MVELVRLVQQKSFFEQFLEEQKSTHLRMETVSASGEEAQGQITSGFKPFDWKTLRKESQEVRDPARNNHKIDYSKASVTQCQR